MRKNKRYRRWTVAGGGECENGLRAFCGQRNGNGRSEQDGEEREMVFFQGIDWRSGRFNECDIVDYRILEGLTPQPDANLNQEEEEEDSPRSWVDEEYGYELYCEIIGGFNDCFKLRRKYHNKAMVAGFVGCVLILPFAPMCYYLYKKQSIWDREFDEAEKYCVQLNREMLRRRFNVHWEVEQRNSMTKDTKGELHLQRHPVIKVTVSRGGGRRGDIGVVRNSLGVFIQTPESDNQLDPLDTPESQSSPSSWSSSAPSMTGEESSPSSSAQSSPTAESFHGPNRNNPGHRRRGSTGVRYRPFDENAVQMARLVSSSAYGGTPVPVATVIQSPPSNQACPTFTDELLHILQQNDAREQQPHHDDDTNDDENRPVTLAAHRLDSHGFISPI